MSHDINILLNIFGRKPDGVFSHKSQRRSIVDSAQILLNFGEASATCESNWISPIKVREIQVTGTSGLLKADLIKQEVEYINKAMRAIRSYNAEPLKLEIEEFIESVKGKPFNRLCTAESALDTFEIVALTK